MGLGGLFLQRLRSAICGRARLQEISRSQEGTAGDGLHPVAVERVESFRPSRRRGERTLLSSEWRIQRRRFASDAAAAQPFHAAVMGSELRFGKLDQRGG